MTLPRPSSLRAALADLARPAVLIGAGAAAVLMTAPLPAGSAAPQALSQCRAGEEVIYSCRFGPPARAAIGSVCGRASSVHYRFGPPGKPAIDLASAPDWSNIHTGRVRGQGSGGYQEHVRFTQGTTHYLVFRGEDGALADRPGRTYSGIAVQGGANGERELGTLACKAGLRASGSLGEALAKRAPPSLDLDEVPDGPFDAWF